MKRTVIVAAGAVAVFAAVLGAAVWMGTLRTELGIDGNRFRPGDPVHFTIGACSNSLLPMRTDDGKPSWQITDDAGEVVADSSHQVFTLALTTLTWAPRQCRQASSVEWDQREWNQRALGEGELAGVPRRGARVPAGTYELTARWGDLGPEQHTFQIE